MPGVEGQPAMEEAKIHSMQNYTWTDKKGPKNLFIKRA